jgi:hypothetical protein
MRKLPILTLFFAAGLLSADKPLAPFVRKALPLCPLCRVAHAPDGVD